MALFKIVSCETNNEIVKIMANCFSEPIPFVKFFLENKSKNSRCYICMENNDIISVLHSLLYKMKLGKSYFNCSYIYGACTAEPYRKKGYMKKLIKFYEVDSKINKLDFSLLVPEHEDLERYYSKLGYINFFKIKEVNLSLGQLLKLCRTEKKVQNKQNKNNYKKIHKNIEKLRLDIYNNIDNVLYTSRDIWYAENLYRNFGGKIISSDGGYGICEPISVDTLEIKDFTCKNEFIPDLLEKIRMNFQEYKNFKIKTSPSDTFFKENSKTYFWGMIKPLSSLGKKAIEDFCVSKKHEAYLGLALD